MSSVKKDKTMEEGLLAFLKTWYVALCAFSAQCSHDSLFKLFVDHT